MASSPSDSRRTRPSDRRLSDRKRQNSHGSSSVSDRECLAALEYGWIRSESWQVLLRIRGEHGHQIGGFRLLAAAEQIANLLHLRFGEAASFFQSPVELFENLLLDSSHSAIPQLCESVRGDQCNLCPDCTFFNDVIPSMPWQPE